jgi:hypothetical protein
MTDVEPVPVLATSFELQVPDPTEQVTPEAVPTPEPEVEQPQQPAAEPQPPAAGAQELPAPTLDSAPVLQLPSLYVAPRPEPFAACHDCRLTFFGRMLRCLAPKHRRIPLRHPMDTGYPYYHATRWSRSPAAFDATWIEGEASEPEPAAEPQPPAAEPQGPVDAEPPAPVDMPQHEAPQEEPPTTPEP